jgi:hypothetical protein
MMADFWSPPENPRPFVIFSILAEIYMETGILKERTS